MKFFLIAALTTLSLNSFADHHKKGEKMDKMMDEMSFEDAKQHMSSKLEKKIQLHQEAKACTDAAKTKEDLKKCREEMRDKMGSMREEHKSKMKEMKDKMKKK
ncbi:MAG: hypothetical protein AB7I27_17585 [Bacteriovoracaceae bacterium]